MDNLKVVWSVKSECGPVRKKNEDAAYPNISGSGVVPFKAGVFDGMGGHKKGEVASDIASSVMNEKFDEMTLSCLYKNGILSIDDISMARKGTMGLQASGIIPIFE